MAKITTSNLDNTINTKLAAGESANAVQQLIRVVVIW